MNRNSSAFYKEIIISFLASIEEDRIITDEATLTNLKALFDSKEAPTTSDLKSIFLEEGKSIDKN